MLGAKTSHPTPPAPPLWDDKLRKHLQPLPSPQAAPQGLPSCPPKAPQCVLLKPGVGTVLSGASAGETLDWMWVVCPEEGTGRGLGLRL